MPKDKEKVAIRWLKDLGSDNVIYLHAGDLLDWFNTDVFAGSSANDKRRFLEKVILEAATKSVS